jgi:hypothetical protein
MLFIDAIIASHASAQFMQTCEHMRADAMSPCCMHSSEQALHIAAVVSSMDIIAIMPISLDGIGRSIMRIIVLHISAQLMHMAMPGMPSIDMEAAHIVQACSAAEQASMHFCIADMSMPAIGPSADSLIIDIICVVSFIDCRTPRIVSAVS